jgi:hypothetical protein
MKLTLSQIYSVITAIRKIDTTVPAGKESFTISEKFCEPLLEQYEKIDKQRTKLVEKYGTKSDKGFQVLEDTDTWESFVKDWSELLSTEIELTIEPISIELALNAGLTPQEARLLKPFIKSV